MRKEQVLLEKHLLTALELVGDSAEKTNKPLKRKTQKTHIEAALKLVPKTRPLEQEPIRTIHHFSCTGGTLFAKCIASMANVLLLNEVDLHSAMPTKNGAKSAFTPSDIISLLRQGDKNLSPDLVTKIFLGDLEILREEQWKVGRSIILRDHSHSHFLSSASIPEQPTLLETVASKLPTRSVVTVRDPIDSWLSMVEHGWHKHMRPSTFDEYCRRYLLFLKRYDGVPIVKYEEFIKAPKKVMQEICEQLWLEYFDEFESVFSSFNFSGDSGRGGSIISIQARRPADATFARAIQTSVHYSQLIKILNQQTAINTATSND